MKPWGLDYWNTGEWQVVSERLRDMEKGNVQFNPKKECLFSALQAVKAEDVRVVILGQDPYPNPGYATGHAFSIPGDVTPEHFPPTLRQFFNEYCSDLSLPMPDRGDLSKWEQQGVLLWNAIPSCRAGSSLSHDWPGEEWRPLTSEIVRRCSKHGVVFALLGGVAQRHLKDIDLDNNPVIITSHPSPRGNLNSKNPFKGSRMFSTINDKLNSIGLEPIDWRLDASESEGQSPPGVPRNPNLRGSGTLLENITRADLGPLPNPRRVHLRK